MANALYCLTAGIALTIAYLIVVLGVRKKFQPWAVVVLTTPFMTYAVFAINAMFPNLEPCQFGFGFLFVVIFEFMIFRIVSGKMGSREILSRFDDHLFVNSKKDK